MRCLLCPICGLVLLSGCSGTVAEVTRPDQPIEAEVVHVQDRDWPWWRGTERNNHAVGPAPPTDWSDSHNLRWKVEVPGQGHATPIVWGERVFVSVADEAEETMGLVCFDRASGQLLWHENLHQGGFMHRHQKNSHASATPACDGQRVFAVNMVNDAIWVSATDFDGRLLWQTEAGPFRSQHGYGSAPCLYGPLVIVAGDNSGSGFLAALHRETGEIVWRIRRDNQPSYGTPIVAEIDGEPLLLLHGQNRTTAYDPETGQQLWSVSGAARITANTPAWSDSLIFTGGGYPETGIQAIQADGSEVAWQVRYKTYVPTPLYVGDRLLVVHDNGVARLLDSSSGEEIWQQRLGGNFSASPTLVDDLVFVPNEQGRLFIFRVADEFEMVAEHALEGGGFASPVICGGELLLRTTSHLYCIAHEAEA